MNTEIQAKVFDLIETLVNAGQQLPIPRERAGAILSLHEQVTGTDVQLLMNALAKSEPVVDFKRP
jgi:hypothetical protein